MIIRNALTILEELSVIENKITQIEKGLIQHNPHIDLEEILKQILRETIRSNK
jgi:hypothetical protein